MKGGVISGTIAHRLISERPPVAGRGGEAAAVARETSGNRTSPVAAATVLNGSHSGYANNAT